VSAIKPRWGSLQRSHEPPSWIWEGKGVKKGRGKERKEEGSGREGGKRGH